MPAGASLIAPLLVTKLGDMKVNTGDSPGLQGLFREGVAWAAQCANSAAEGFLARPSA